MAIEREYQVLSTEGRLVSLESGTSTISSLSISSITGKGASAGTGGGFTGATTDGATNDSGGGKPSGMYNPILSISEFKWKNDQPADTWSKNISSIDMRTEYVLALTGGRTGGSGGQFHGGYTIGEVVTQSLPNGGTCSAVVTIFEYNTLGQWSPTAITQYGYILGVRNCGPTSGTASAGPTQFQIASTAGNQIAGASGSTWEVLSISETIRPGPYRKSILISELTNITGPTAARASLSYGHPTVKTEDFRSKLFATPLTDYYNLVNTNHETYSATAGAYMGNVILERYSGVTLEVNAATGGSGGAGGIGLSSEIR